MLKIIRDAFREMLESITANGHSFEECKEVLKKSSVTIHYEANYTYSHVSTYHLDIKLDSGFKEFYGWCKANDIPVIIVSRQVLHYLHTKY